jgi:hypothetical protein
MSKRSYFAVKGKCSATKKLQQLKRRSWRFLLSSYKPNCTNQVSERIGEALGSGSDNGQVLADRLWEWLRERKQRYRKTDHSRWIRDFIEADPEHTLFLTLTFCRFETVVHAKETARRLVRWLKGVVDGWVKVFERGDGGVHVQVVLHAVMHLSGGVDVDAGLKAIAEIVRAHKKSERIGNWRVEPIRDAAGLAQYLTKTLEPGASGRVSGCSVTYSQNIKRRPWWLSQQADTPDPGVTSGGSER